MVLQSFQHAAHRLNTSRHPAGSSIFPPRLERDIAVARPTDSAPKTTPRTTATDTHPTPRRPAPNMRRNPAHHTRSARLRRNLEPDKSKAFYLAPRTASSGSRKPGRRAPVDTSHHGDRRALIATAGYPSHTPSNPAVCDVGRRERSVRGEEFIFKEVHCGGANGTPILQSSVPAGFQTAQEFIKNFHPAAQHQPDGNRFPMRPNQRISNGCNSKKFNHILRNHFRYRNPIFFFESRVAKRGNDKAGAGLKIDVDHQSRSRLGNMP